MGHGSRWRCRWAAYRRSCGVPDAPTADPVPDAHRTKVKRSGRRCPSAHLPRLASDPQAALPHSAVAVLAVRPPDYFPPVAHAALLAQAGAVVIADTFAFSRQATHNRARILTSQGAQWLTVPRGHAPVGTPLGPSAVADDGWPRRHVRALRTAYGMAPFAEALLPEVEALLGRPARLDRRARGGHDGVDDPPPRRHGRRRAWRPACPARPPRSPTSGTRRAGPPCSRSRPSATVPRSPAPRRRRGVGLRRAAAPAGLAVAPTRQPALSALA